MFRTGKGTRLSMHNVRERDILSALNRCEVCHKPEDDCTLVKHEYKRDDQLPQWRGWHAGRRGLGSNLYRLGVPDMVIQRILGHSSVSTTATYYIKTAADNVPSAMAKLEDNIPQTVRDTYGTLKPESTQVQ